MCLTSNRQLNIHNKTGVFANREIATADLSFPECEVMTVSHSMTEPASTGITFYLQRVQQGAQQGAIFGLMRGTAGLGTQLLLGAHASPKMQFWVNQTLLAFTYFLYSAGVLYKIPTTPHPYIMQDALIDTLPFMLINLVLEGMSKVLGDFAIYCNTHCSEQVSQVMNIAAGATRFGIFAYTTVKNGDIESAAAITTGAIVEKSLLSLR